MAPILRLFGFSMLLLLAGCNRLDRPVSQVERARWMNAYQKRYPEPPKSVDGYFRDIPAAEMRPVRPDSARAAAIADSVFRQMSLDQKIGQLLIVNLQEGTFEGWFRDQALGEIRHHAVGGFLVPRAMHPRTVRRRARTLQRNTRIPLFIAADYERGVGTYNTILTELPSNMALGATADTLLAAAAGRLTALEARAIGVNLLLAPVVDVNNNPLNPVINIRSFGEDPRLVGRLAAAFVHEAEATGLMTTLKHFPGHGNTTTDTHTDFGRIESDRATLDSVELRPYRMVFRGAPGPTAVMSTHLWARALNRNELPATFSPEALDGVLRKELGFGGLILTDDIKMGALRDHYSHRDRILRPLLAGADILMTPPNVPRAIAFIREAIGSGVWTEAELDARVWRILFVKAKAGLFEDAAPSASLAGYLKRHPGGAALLAGTIASRALTVVAPGQPAPTRTAALIQLSNIQESRAIGAAMDDFENAVVPIGAVRMDREPRTEDLRHILELVEQADNVILALYLRLRSDGGGADILPGWNQILVQLETSGKPVRLVVFGNPYALRSIPGRRTVVVAYDQSPASIDAAAAYLGGPQSARPWINAPTGRLPITIRTESRAAGE